MAKKVTPAGRVRKEPSDQEIKSAQSKIDGFVRAKARLQNADREEISAAALNRWRVEQANTPRKYADRALQDFLRTQKRRATDPDTDAVEGAVDAASEGIEDEILERIDATPSTKRAKRRARVRRYLLGEADALKAAVRAECLKQFRQRVGVEWQTKLERHVLSPPDKWNEIEEAYEIHEQLRLAMVRAVDFVNRPRNVGGAPLGLNWWVPRFIAPLVDHAMMKQRPPARGTLTDVDAFGAKYQKARPPAGPREHKSARHRLVATWDTYDLIGLTRADGGGSRILDATEYAIVWLLGGGWPEHLSMPKKGLTPSEVIQIEARTFRAAIEEVGHSWERGESKGGSHAGPARLPHSLWRVVTPRERGDS